MNTTTVRVSTEVRDRVAALARTHGRQMQQILEDAVTAYEREWFFTRLSAGYAALADDERAWADVQSERAAEAHALADGLSDDAPSVAG